MTIIALHELQIIDNRIRRLERERLTIPEKQVLDGKLSELNRLDKVVSDRQRLLAREKQEQKSLEDIAGSLSEKITHEESRLYGGTVSSPKELKSIENEVKALKNRRDEEETGLLEKLQAIEDLTAKTAKISEEIQIVRAAADVAQEAYEKSCADIDDRLRELQRQREETLKIVAPDSLKIYDRLRHEKQGLAVAELDGSTCGGCHMELPAGELQKIVPEEQVWRCPHCRRILVRRV